MYRELTYRSPHIDTLFDTNTKLSKTVIFRTLILLIELSLYIKILDVLKKLIRFIHIIILESHHKWSKLSV